MFGDVTSIKMLWKPAIGETLHAEQELDNAVDKFAVKVVKNNETVGHLPCEYSRILWYFIARGGKKYAWKWLAVDATANTYA